MRVIRTVTNTPVEIQEEAEEVNMCKAIEEMMEDSRQEGEVSGALRKAKETACALAAMGLPRRTDCVSGQYRSGSRERIDFELRGDWLADKQQRYGTGRAKGRERLTQ